MPQSLTASLGAVHRARSLLELARSQGSSKGSVSLQEERLLAALEGYAATLAEHGHPMPYRMRSELAMYRAICKSAPPPPR